MTWERRIIAFACVASTACGEFSVAATPGTDAAVAPIDGSVDGSVDGGGADGCPVKLCSRFDPPFSVTPFQWQGSVGSASDLRIVSPGLLSPNALRVQSPTGVVYLFEDVGAPKRISVRLNLWIDTFPASGNPSRPLELVCSTGKTFDVLRVFNDGTLDFTDGQGHDTPVSKIMLKTWLEVDVDVMLGTTSSTTTVTTPIDQKHGAGTAAGCDGTTEIRLGDLRENASEAVFFVDDIQADWGP